VVREQEWLDLLARIQALKDGDYRGAADVIREAAAYLDLHRGSLDAAFADLALLDSGGSPYGAVALATALGRVPDEATALRLADAIGVVTGSGLKVAILHALGQDRYGTGRPEGGWSTTTGMAEVCATLEPPVAAKLVALAWVDPGRPGPDMPYPEFAGAILTVLANSQGQAPVRRLLADLATFAEDDYYRRLPGPLASALAQGTDDESLAITRRLAASRIPEVREAFGRALLMRGDTTEADGLLREIVDPETPAERKQELAGQLTFLRTKDAGYWARVEALVLDLLARDDRPADQIVALTLSNGLSLHAKEPVRIADAVLRLAFRDEAPLEIREAAVTCFQPVGAERVRMRKAMETLMFDEKAPATVRARAADTVIEWTPQPDQSALREDLRGRLPAEVVRRSHYLR
jgi:hypothetical protein